MEQQDPQHPAPDDRQHESPAPRQNITRLALVVELGLAGVALAIGWLMGKTPWELMRSESISATQLPSIVLMGVLATLPMLVVLTAVRAIPLAPLQRLNQIVEELLVPLFSRTTIIEMALICAAAGVGEELLFRGLIQATIAERAGGGYGTAMGLVVGSVVFGACHWITATYAILATAIGLYLGWLLIDTGNLLVPIIAHGLYDFVALLYLVKFKRRGTAMEPTA